MKLLALLASVLTVGCAATSDVDPARFVEPPAGAAEADAMVVAGYGLADPLPLRWVRGDCWDGMGFRWRGGCVFGATFDDLVLVAHPGPGVPVSSTGLAHERAHDRWDDQEHARRQGRVSDPLWGADKNDDYEAGTRVGDMNASLQEAGL